MRRTGWIATALVIGPLLSVIGSETWDVIRRPLAPVSYAGVARRAAPPPPADCSCRPVFEGARFVFVRAAP